MAARCERCELKDRPEWYTLLFVEWDVQKAKQFIADGRKPERMTIKRACSLAGVTRIEQDHTGHVPLDLPGILAPIPPGDFYGFALIDGNHRAIGRKKAGKRFFFAYRLTDAESAACITSKSKVKLLAKQAQEGKKKK